MRNKQKKWDDWDNLYTPSDDGYQSSEILGNVRKHIESEREFYGHSSFTPRQYNDTIYSLSEMMRHISTGDTQCNFVQ